MFSLPHWKSIIFLVYCLKKASSSFFVAIPPGLSLLLVLSFIQVWWAEHMQAHMLLLLLELFAQNYAVGLPVDPQPQIIFMSFHPTANSHISSCFLFPNMNLPPSYRSAISLENRVVVGNYHRGLCGEDLEVHVGNVEHFSGVWTAVDEHWHPL